MRLCVCPSLWINPISSQGNSTGRSHTAAYERNTSDCPTNENLHWTRAYRPTNRLTEQTTTSQVHMFKCVCCIRYLYGREREMSSFDGCLRMCCVVCVPDHSQPAPSPPEPDNYNPPDTPTPLLYLSLSLCPSLAHSVPLSHPQTQKSI